MQKRLSSAERNLLHIPRHRRSTYTVTHRAFAIAGASAWKILPDPVRKQNATVPAFRRPLKTFLFVRTSAPSALGRGEVAGDALYKSTRWH